MNSLAFGDIPTKVMASMGPDLLPPLVTWMWLAALAAVLVFHCGHLVRMGGEHRWFHASHILMLVSMLYMFAGMEYKWKWFPKSWWVVIFWLSTAAIVGWVILHLVQRRAFSLLWVFALIMQAAMIYMWMPNWAPALTWTLVVFYGLETAAWLGGFLDDSKPTMAVAPNHRAPAAPVASGSAATTGAVAVQPGNLAVGLLNDSKPAKAFLTLSPDSVTTRVSMAVMAASMAYMFAAMQLMR